LFISKPFKELFFMAFFWKADAKVRQISELPKLFEEKFSESFHQRSFIAHSLRQYVNCIPFLSRKRMQNYCFKTCPPNVNAYFFQTFCILIAKSLICRRVLRQGFSAALQGWVMRHLIIITRTRMYARFNIHKARKKTRLDAFANASRRVGQFVKTNSLKLQGLF